MSVLSREHLTGEVEMRDVATLMELMTKTISSARYPPTQTAEKRWGKYAFVVQVCCGVSQSDVNASSNFWSILEAAAGKKQMQKLSKLSSRMKTRILCCLLLSSVASERLPAAIVQLLQALLPCQAQTNQKHPQQVQPPLCAAAGPPEMPLLRQATVQSS